MRRGAPTVVGITSIPGAYLTLANTVTYSYEEIASSL